MLKILVAFLLLIGTLQPWIKSLASVIGTPTCRVKAKVLRTTVNSSGKSQEVLLRLVGARKYKLFGLLGDCSHVKIDGLIQVTDNHLILKKNDQLAASTVAGSTLSTNGKAIPWTHWTEISIENRNRQVPDTLSLQGGTVVGVIEVMNSVKMRAPNCKLLSLCKNLAAVNCQAEVDGPFYYIDFRQDSLVMCCGGCCDTSMENLKGTNCSQCPPKEWTCD